MGSKKYIYFSVFLILSFLIFTVNAQEGIDCQIIESTGLYSYCPEGTQLLGGGCEFSTGIRTVSPGTSGTFWNCDGEGNNYAICCSVPEDKVITGDLAGGQRCSDGYTLTGGGCRENSGLIMQTYPIENNLWACQSSNAATGGGSISSIIAICIDNTDYSCETVTSKISETSASITCPSSKTVTGGGCKSYNRDNSLIVSKPENNGWYCETSPLVLHGPNDFNIDTQAYARCCGVIDNSPEESCKDTDGGIDYYNQGSISFSTGDIIYFDLCIDKNILEERFCGGDVFIDNYECPNGCENGACIDNFCASIDCAQGFVCKEGQCIENGNEGMSFCKDSDGGVVLDVRGEMVLKVDGKKAITAQDNCAYDKTPEDPNGIRYIETKSCEAGKDCYVQELSCEGFEDSVEGDYSESFNCFNGCKNGACIPDEKPRPEKIGYRYASWECQGGESFVSKDDTSCKLPEKWEKYAKDFCKDSCIENDGDTKCGTSYYSINKECYYGNDQVLIVELIPRDGYDIEQAEIIDDVYFCKNSCPLDDKCYPFGYRKSNEYCSDRGSFVDQLGSEKSCDNNFECSSNLCIDSQCISSSLWQKFLKWLGNWFG